MNGAGWAALSAGEARRIDKVACGRSAIPAFRIATSSCAFTSS